MPITSESLKVLGFVSTISFGRKKKATELNWRGAPLWWDGQTLWYRREPLNLRTIEEVSEYIRSLKITRGRGKKPV